MGVDLGTVTVELIGHSAILTDYNFASVNVKLLPRYYHLSSSNFAENASFPADVEVRVYFEQGELDKMNAANLGDNGLTSHLASSIHFTHYFGPEQDCDFSNNNAIISNVDLIDNATYTKN